ncbi:HDIG domain-containing metalloprotein [Pyrinomonas methylaliphatogenes]|jgi:putative nucleotidyltransferase with HDIG domain|uniref:Metal dependent phosphohydrolase n=1 Tax=Pyrinomonas methylaliphatogenes TaxID=454194 RepID=A0A0B6WT85_9BACT|nr:HDIG domain-containing metalloprotein [Pyrinomonas methylaliphatogenes]MBX5479382.1 HDIG domain-containing protein [Pyrinomonas methylaliphatogenes]CDM64221.1 metal dependent phosphohydrolase [Pyrinomonas methylaliphatogenes]
MGTEERNFDREEAWRLLCEYTKNEALRRHALAVEAAMRACATKYGGPEDDPNVWGLVGLLHDLDYEMYPTPDQHPYRGAEILRERGYPEDFIRAILSHASYTGVPRDTQMARALFACDELCGFLVACALVRPSRSFDDMEVSSVKKKLKDKAFARNVSREDIRQGAAELGVDLDEHIGFVIQALRPVQRELGLGAISRGI